jgi:hypothetical protein
MSTFTRIIWSSCVKVTELVEKKTVAPLTLKEKTQFYLHLRICDSCSKYVKQSKFMDEALEKMLREKSEESADIKSNPELKERLLKINS